MLENFLEWTKGLLNNGINALTPIFVIIAIIGVFITMAGAKKTGTRVSSLSFLTYLLLKVLLK